MGLQKSGDVPTSELWSIEYGSFLYRSCMSKRRFEFLAARLRFDEKKTRKNRRKVDNLAPVRKIWDLLINNCTQNYIPSENMTIDEQQRSCSIESRTRSILSNVFVVEGLMQIR